MAPTPTMARSGPTSWKPSFFVKPCVLLAFATPTTKP